MNLAQETFERYERIRDRLPAAAFRSTPPEEVPDLLALAERFDVFFLDAWGVLNVGAQAIPRAAEHLRALQALGKTVLLVSNAATYAVAQTRAKLARLGFHFEPWQVVTSRAELVPALAAYPENWRWGLMAPREGQEDLPPACFYPDAPEFEDCDGFLFLSTVDWDAQRQQSWLAALERRPRPIVLGNPDIIAPLEHYTSIEPGHWVLFLPPRLFAEVRTFGKPFAGIFELAVQRLAAQGIAFDPARTAMFGDTLHTDILGARAFGIASVLVRDWGFSRSLHLPTCYQQSGLAPDFVLPAL